MPVLRSVVAKQCEQQGCKLYRKRVGSHVGFCEECGEPLVPVLGWDPRRITWAVGVPVALAFLGYSLVSFLAHRPRPLTEERQQRLEALVRVADRDQVVTQQEKGALDTVVKEERLDPKAAADFVDAERQRQQESRRGVTRGHRLAAKGRYEEARQEYQHAVEVDPGNAMAWANLGLANAATGHEQEALESYTKALQLDPKSWPAHYNLGLLWARRGDNEQAFQHLEEAFAALPDPASPERQAMVVDLRAAAPAVLRRDPRFPALLTSFGDPAQ
jgi:tetratricopeptide (TPR) repeat protein